MWPGSRISRNQTDRATIDAEDNAPAGHEFRMRRQPKNECTSAREKLDDLQQQKRRLMARKAGADVRSQNSPTRLKHVQAETDEVSADTRSRIRTQKLLERRPELTLAQKLRQELTELVAEQRIVDKALEAVKKLKDECPTCGQPVSSGTKASTGEKKSARSAELEALIAGIRRQLSEHSNLEVAKSRLEDKPAPSRRGRRVEGRTAEHSGVYKPNAAD
jgi:hypothetical protein